MLNKTIRCNQVTFEAMDSILEQNTLAIRIPDYAPLEVCNVLSTYFAEHPNRTQYLHDEKVNGEIEYFYYGVDRIGLPYSITFGKETKSLEHQAYYKQALSTLKNIRSAIAPFTSPIDKVRLELDETWPHGANLGHFDNQKLYAGIGRVIDAEHSKLSEDTPHVDYLVSKQVSFCKQLSAIVYLTVPENGGELEIWDIANPPKVFTKNWRKTVPDPLLIRPKRGELIIINTEKPHAIRQFDAGNRISIQCFIGYNPNQPLSMWS